MNKEDIIKLGVSAELAEKVFAAIQEEYVKSGNFIPKAKFDEVVADRNGIKEQLATANSSIKALKESASDNNALKEQIQTLQDQQKEAERKHKSEMADLRKRSAIIADIGATAHDPEAVLKLVDLGKVSVADDGSLIGWGEIKADLLKTKAWLFKANQQPGQPRGSNPGPSNPNPGSGEPGTNPPGPQDFNPEEFAKQIGPQQNDKSVITPDYYFGGAAK